jgi:hypothetical protein
LLKKLEEKSALLCPKARVGQIPEHFIGGSICLSKGGSIQMGVEEAEAIGKIGCVYYPA